jgi:hypothetical protein
MLNPPSPGRNYLAYLWPTVLIEQPGLGHMKEVVRTLTRESHRCGRTALIPPLLANPQHNPIGLRSLQWSTYFDWSGLPIHDPQWGRRNDILSVLGGLGTVRILRSGEPAQLDDLKELAVVRVFPDCNIFGEWFATDDLADPEALREPAFSGHFPSSVEYHAKQVLKEVGVPQGVLHIRRGDLSCEENEPRAVIRYMAEKGVSAQTPVFILTNEGDPGYRNAIRAAFPNVVFEQEVSYLRRLEAESRDNYLIYRIGGCIQFRQDTLSLGSMRFMRQVHRQPTSPVLGKVRGLFKRFAPERRLMTHEWLLSHFPNK